MADRRQPWWARALRRVGVQVATIPKPTLDPQAVAEGRIVFVHDDDTSPLVDVIRWASHTFRVPAAEAAVKVAQVHREGAAAFGPFAADDVAQVMERGRTEAERLGLAQLRFGPSPR